MGNFILDFVKYNEGTEVPPDFAMWSAIGAVSCVLGRKVFIDMGNRQIYPNEYIVLVGGSGIKKSTAVRTAEKFIRSVSPPPNIIAQKITTEALIKNLSTDNAVVEGIVNLEQECVGFAVVDELANFLNKKVYEEGLGQLLTPLYDGNEIYEYSTISRGKQTLRNLCFGILSGATVDWLQQAIPEVAVGGGVTSRFIFVYVETRPPPQAITTFTDEKRKLEGELCATIQSIANVSGEVRLTTDAWKFWKDEYDKFYTQSTLFYDKNLSGYANRRGEHLQKLAMILSLSESSSMVIERKHLEAATGLLKLIELNLPIVMSLITSTQRGATLAKVYNYIKKHGPKGCPKASVLASFLHVCTNRDLVEILDTLYQARKVKLVVENGETKYVGV